MKDEENISNTPKPYKSQRSVSKKRINRTKIFKKTAKKFKGMSTVTSREKEYKILQKQINCFLKYNVNNILYITGVPGSGKTHTTLTLLNYLEINFSYINCSTLKSKNSIYTEIYNSLSCANCLENANLNALRLHLTKCDQKHILVIDEIDFLLTKNETFLYNLFEMPFLENANIFIIAISNTLGCLSSKVESRIGKNRVEFKPYTSDQLMKAIMASSKTSKVDKKSLELITKRIASSTGDIRKVKEIVEGSENDLSTELDLNKTSIILRDMSVPLLKKFVISLNIYQKILVYLNTEHLKSIFVWFDDFKSFCKLKNYPVLNFSDFMVVLNDLISFDIYKLRKGGVYATCNYIREEMELAMRNDSVFKSFKEV